MRPRQRRRGETNLHGAEPRNMKAGTATPESPAQQVLRLVRKAERLARRENERYRAGGIVKATATRRGDDRVISQSCRLLIIPAAFSQPVLLDTLPFLAKAEPKAGLTLIKTLDKITLRVHVCSCRG